MPQQSSTPEPGPRHLVVMGVSGVGKTTVAEQLSIRLGYDLAEGDDFHPPANIEKMSSGSALDDEDRWPWLRALADWVREHHQQGVSTVMTCSALRRSYRDVLREGAVNTFFVHLTGEQTLLLERMSGRKHFMPPALLQSQFATLEGLETDEQGITVDVTDPPERIVDKVVDGLALEAG
jgi:carbohydrate kinase (thermoresistant glucokinase family)